MPLEKSMLREMNNAPKKLFSINNFPTKLFSPGFLFLILYLKVLKYKFYYNPPNNSNGQQRESNILL